MPGVAVHFVFADRVLGRWRAARAVAPPPFDLDDPGTLNAFYHGAVGPDLGYFPGGHSVLSDLAHCVRPATLTRRLLALADTGYQRAFALGWLTHVLADQMVHPLVGGAVGELLTGSRDRVVDGSTDLLAHIRVEIGLDAWYAERHPRVRARRLVPALDDRGIAFLARAYTETYGVAVPPGLLRRCHRATTRRAGQALASMGFVKALMQERGVAHARQDAVELEELSLDTGRVAEAEPAHPGRLRALRGLERLVAACRPGSGETDRGGSGPGSASDTRASSTTPVRLVRPANALIEA